MTRGCEQGAIESCAAPVPPRRDWLLAFAAALVLTDACDAVLYGAFGRGAMLLPGLPIARVPLLGVFAATVLLLGRDLRGAVDHARAAWFLWPAVALAFVSALWSDRPVTTIVWASALLGTSAFGVALAGRFSAGAQARLIAAVVAAVALGSGLAVQLWPAFGIAPRGQWQGLYVHRNLLGKVMALGVTAALVAAAGSRRRIAALGALLLCGGVLLATRSRASLLTAAIAAVAVLLLVGARRWRRHAFAILASGAGVVGLAVALLITTKPGLTLLARSATLSDRTQIWSAVLAETRKAPWLGHGYGAFWPGPAGTQARAVVRIPVVHAHNGALDLAAELGVAGLVVVLVPLGFIAIAALRHALESHARACLWPATYLVFFVASNAGESALLRHKLSWALYVAVACHVARRPSPGAIAPPCGSLSMRPGP